MKMKVQRGQSSWGQCWESGCSDNVENSVAVAIAVGTNDLAVGTKDFAELVL